MAISDTGAVRIIEIFRSRGVYIAPNTAELFDGLLGQERIVSMMDLVDYIYRKDPDGGPLCYQVAIRSIVYKARIALKAAKTIPWRIETYFGRGYRLLYLDIREML